MVYRKRRLAGANPAASQPPRGWGPILPCPRCQAECSLGGDRGSRCILCAAAAAASPPWADKYPRGTPLKVTTAGWERDTSFCCSELVFPRKRELVAYKVGCCEPEVF